MELNWGMRNATWMTITPTMAAYWLQLHNNLNRHQRTSVKTQYERDMAAGRWMDIGDPITFDWFGELINGQHRLESIVSSNVHHIENLVVTGMPPIARSVVDTHAKRSTRDAFDGAGKGDLLGDGSISKNTAAGMWARIMHGLAQIKGHETRQELIVFANTYPEGGLFALEEFGKHRRIRMVTVAPVLAAVARAWFHYGGDEVLVDRLRSFSEVLATGIQKHPADRMVIMWREVLREMRGKNSNAQPEIYGKTARAIQAYISGVALGKIYMPSEEPFPLPDRTATGANPSSDRMAGILPGLGGGRPRPNSMAASSSQH